MIRAAFYGMYGFCGVVFLLPATLSHLPTRHVLAFEVPTI